MSVTGPSYNINAIQKLSELELQRGFSVEASWHNKVRQRNVRLEEGALRQRLNVCASTLSFYSKLRLFFSSTKIVATFLSAVYPTA